MANYLPPTEILPIFDDAVFQDGDDPLTYNTAINEFLRYPTAQGTETFNNPSTQNKVVIDTNSISVIDYTVSTTSTNFMTPSVSRIRNYINNTTMTLTSESIDTLTWNVDTTGNPYFNALAEINSFNQDSGDISLDFKNKQNLTFEFTMNQKITNFQFQNGVKNGNYIIYMTGPPQDETLYKNSCINNLPGDQNIGINTIWIIKIYYTGLLYIVNFQNYT